MALTLENGTFAWQRVKHGLAQAGATHTGATPAAVDAFRTLKDYLVGNKGNPQLQYIPFSDADVTTNTGYSPIGGVASTVYGFYVKKRTTATDSYLRLYNDTTNVTITLAYVGGMLSVSGDEFFAIYPDGLAFGTDLTISADTGAGTGTESAAGDAGDGFVIIGA